MGGPAEWASLCIFMREGCWLLLLQASPFPPFEGSLRSGLPCRGAGRAWLGFRGGRARELWAGSQSWGSPSRPGQCRVRPLPPGPSVGAQCSGQSPGFTLRTGATLPPPSVWVIPERAYLAQREIFPLSLDLA